MTSGGSDIEISSRVLKSRVLVYMYVSIMYFMKQKNAVSTKISDFFWVIPDAVRVSFDYISLFTTFTNTLISPPQSFIVPILFVHCLE